MRVLDTLTKLLDNNIYTCDVSELHILALDDEYETKRKYSDDLYLLTDALQVALNMLERGWDPHSFYDTDEISRFKGLIKKYEVGE